MKYRHKKTGNIYRHLAVVLDDTNAREHLPADQRLMVVYCPDDDEGAEIYARDQTEFDEKFEIVREPNS